MLMKNISVLLKVNWIKISLKKVKPKNGGIYDVKFSKLQLFIESSFILNNCSVCTVKLTFAFKFNRKLIYLIQNSAFMFLFWLTYKPKPQS